MGNVNLLLVEDNFINQKLILLQVKHLGYNVDIANNGIEAIEKFSKNSYDLILMDLMMPEMDGLEATINIRNIEKSQNIHTPIIGLTANTYDSDRERCLESGMDEYMAKPFDLEIFLNILKVLNVH